METHDVDVMIIGAGPVGLLLANFLGAAELRVLVAEALPALIDYPRGVGIDDESLRAFQAAGLVDNILPHTTPNHPMHFVDGKGRTFASIEPRTDEYGWPRRSTPSSSHWSTASPPTASRAIPRSSSAPRRR